MSALDHHSLAALTQVGDREGRPVRARIGVSLRREGGRDIPSRPDTSNTPQGGPVRLARPPARNGERTPDRLRLARGRPVGLKAATRSLFRMTRQGPARAQGNSLIRTSPGATTSSWRRGDTAKG